MNKKGLATAALKHPAEIFCGIFSYFFQCSYYASRLVRL